MRSRSVEQRRLAHASAVVEIRELASRVTTRPTPTAIHEAAHEWVARQVGFDDARAFVRRGGEEGATYYTFRSPASLGRDGRRRVNRQSALRKRAAVTLAGPIAESLHGGGDVPGCDELLRSEGVTADDLLPYVASAAEEFDGDSERARQRLDEMFEEVRALTIFDLRRAWPQILRRARELDEAAPA